LFDFALPSPDLDATQRAQAEQDEAVVVASDGNRWTVCGLICRSGERIAPVL